MYLRATITAALLALPAVNANLNQLAQAAGKLYFGSATDNSELSDSAYVAILLVLCSAQDCCKFQSNRMNYIGRTRTSSVRSRPEILRNGNVGPKSAIQFGISDC